MKRSSYNNLMKLMSNYNNLKGHHRLFCSNVDIKSFQNEIFDEEIKKQKNSIGRIEKIQVEYIGIPQNVKMVMNKHISTPYNCAQHINELIRDRSVVALINDQEPWDMHRPLENDCKLKLLHFKEGDAAQVANRAYWRSCSFLLGVVASRAFKSQYKVNLHSFPSPNIKSGSFVYDVSIPELENHNWTPKTNELRLLSAEFTSFCQNHYPFERLVVSEEIALKIFSSNPFKIAQIPSISENHDGKIILYRVGDYIDISRGPMIANTEFIGRLSIMAVHKINSEDGTLFRFQGISLPKGVMLNHFAYGILENRAKQLNTTRSPNPIQSQNVESAVN